MAALLRVLLAAAALAGEPAYDHNAPEPAVQSSQEGRRQRVLAELWQRHILSADMTSYGTQDLALLERVRAAESDGAFRLLRQTYHGLGGFAVSDHPGSASGRLLLTKEGFDRYLFLRSQQALAYFQTRDVEAKDAFRLKDEQDQPLFTPDGLLTEAGAALYARVRAGLEVRWKLPDGAVAGNRPHRPAKAPPAAQPQTSPPASAPAGAAGPAPAGDDDSD